MDFLAMIALGCLGLAACGRLFGFLFKLMGRGFDALEDATLGGGRRRRSNSRSFWDDDE
jgi:hypothetical protein